MTPYPPEAALRAWLDAVRWALPMPPGDASGWGSLLGGLGPRRVLATTPSGLDVCDRSLLAALLEALGRPVSPGEHDYLLLATPVPLAEVEPALRRLLHHPSYWVRQNAAWVVGLGSHPASDALLPLLDDADNDVRRASAWGLGRHATPEVVRALATRPWDVDPTVDGARLEALAPHLASVRRWVGDVPDGPGRQLLEAAVRAADGAVDGLAAWLQHDVEPLRHAAGVCLAAVPGAAAEAAEQVLAAIRAAPGVDSQRGAILALAAAGEEGVELAVSLLGDEAWALRQCGAMALGQAGPHAEDAVGALERCLDDDDPDVQREAALALLSVGHSVDLAQAMLLRSVTREGRFLARAMATGATLGPVDALTGRCPPDANLLSLALAPGDDRLRGVACLLLAQALPEAFGPLMGALAADEARRVPLEVRRAAAAATLLAGHVPGEAAVRLRLLLGHGEGELPQPKRLVGEGARLARIAFTDGDAPVRAAALRALRALGPEAEPFRSLLAWQAAHDPDADVRRLAGADATPAWAPRAIGEQVRVVALPAARFEPAARAQALRDVWAADTSLGLALGRALPLADDDRELSREAARLRGRGLRGVEAEAVCRRALMALDDPRWTVREAAADLLGAVPPQEISSGLRDELVEALGAMADSDYDGDVQVAAAAAAASLRQEGAWPASR